MVICQLTFFASSSHVIRSVPLVEEALQYYQHVRVGLLKDSSLMGSFSLPPPLLDSSPSVSFIKMKSSSTVQNESWIILYEYNINNFGAKMSLSPIELDYEAIYSTCVSHTISSIDLFDQSLDYGTSSNPLSCIFSTNESIMQIRILDDASWDNHHHHSSLLDFIEVNISDIYLLDLYICFVSYVSIKEADYEKNLLNIEETIPIEISVKLGVVENIHVGASYSPSEIETYKALFQEFCDAFSSTYEGVSGIEPNIMVQEIKTYPNSKLVWQCIGPVHPKKATVIKSEVEKILHASFTYLFPLFDRVSNIVPVMKKQGTIR